MTALYTVVSAFSGPRPRRGSMGRNQHRQHRTFFAVSKCLIMMLMVRICCSLSDLITKPMTEATYHPAVTPNSLPDSIFLEIFAFCLSSIPSEYLYNTRHAQEWQILVQVCKRWEQFIYGSPRYIRLHLHCSNSRTNGTPFKMLYRRNHSR